jgi:hypothetical protein
MKANLVVTFGSVVLSLVVGCSHLFAPHPIVASKMVTVDDAALLLGGKASLHDDTTRQPEDSPGRTESACEYDGPDGGHVFAVFDADPSKEIASRTWEETKEYYSTHGGVQQLSGIGDDAYLTRGPGAVEIWVQKGNVGFNVDVMGGVYEQTSVADLESVAKRVAAKL